MTQQDSNMAPVVFVVDDDIDVREGLKSVMGRSGCGARSSPRLENSWSGNLPTQ